MHAKEEIAKVKILLRKREKGKIETDEHSSNSEVRKERHVSSPFPCEESLRLLLYPLCSIAPCSAFGFSLLVWYLQSHHIKGITKCNFLSPEFFHHPLLPILECDHRDYSTWETTRAIYLLKIPVLFYKIIL